MLLSDARGIPKARAPGLQAALAELNEAGFEVVAISLDKPEFLTNAAEQNQLTFKLLSDAGGMAMRAFGPAYRGLPSQFSMLVNYSGQAHHAMPVPAVYVFDANGTITC